MKWLLLAQLRFLARAPWSALAAVFGVTLAVASIVAVHLIGTAVERSLTGARPPHIAGLSHVLTVPAPGAVDYFRLRRAWRAHGWPEIEALVPIVEGHRIIGDRQVRVVGVDWLAYGDAVAVGATADAGLRTVQLLDPRALIVDRALGIAAGGTLAIDGVEYRVVAQVDAGLGPIVYADIGAAQRLLGRSPDTVDLVGVAATDAAAVWRRRIDAVMPGFSAGFPQAALPRQPILQDYPVRPVASELPTATFARAILFNVGALGVLALLVAWFLVYQVAMIWLERQRPVFARLRALGVTGGSIGAPFVGILGVLGLVATAAGLGAGIGLARLLVNGAAPAGTPPLAVQLDGYALAKASLSGLGVCLVGGLLATFRRAPAANAVSPLTTRLRLLLILAAVAVAAVGITRAEMGLAGGFAAILGASAAMILLLNPLLVWLDPRRRVLRRTRSTASGSGRSVNWTLIKLGAREAVWQPGVLSVALAALALAVAASMGVGLMVDSLRADFVRMMALRLSGDLYASGSPATVAAATAWLAQTRPDWRVDRHGETRVRVGHAGDPTAVPARLGYARIDATESARYGLSGSLPADGAIVNERLARELGVGSGDAVRIAGAWWRVTHVDAGLGDSEPRLLIDERGLDALGIAPAFDRITIHLDGADSPAAAAAGTALAQRFPQLAVVERDVVRERAFATFDQTFAMTRALTLLALIVAGVGIYNALTALRLAQAPTRRLLEVQGVVGRELRFIALVRALSVGAIAVLVALPLGVAIAWILCNVVNPRAFGWTVGLTLDGAGWLRPMALGIGAALLAGLLPAPRETGVLDEAV